MSQDSVFAGDPLEPESPWQPPPEPQRQTPGQRQVDRSGGQVINIRDADEEQAKAVVAELLEHRRRGQGKLIGLAGLPRHGKSEFAKQLRDHLSVGVQSVENYAKTYSGKVNLYYLPKRHRRDVLIDLAGEDFAKYGDPNVPIQDIEVMARLLWPVLEQLDGIILFVNLPLLWFELNAGGEAGELSEPADPNLSATRSATELMVRSIQTLLKYTIVAKQLKQIRMARPGLTLPSPATGQALPERHVIDDAFQVAGPLPIPVFIAYSKADVIVTTTRPDGLRTPPLVLGRGRQRHAIVRPETADPLVLGRLAFPELFKFLQGYVRYFKFDYLHVVHDPSRTPSPEAIAGEARVRAYAELRGAMPALEFITEHPWGFTTPGTAAALALDRKYRPKRWSQAVATLFSGAPPAPVPARAATVSAADALWEP